jgi:MFS-type transporter involved in bile tolerance (Atg22 family)
VLFILQGFIFIYAGIVKDHLSFNYQTNIYGITGAVFLLYALILYPVLGHLFGHIYPKSPTFGLPCPTTIFTFGLLLWTDKKIPKYVLVIPFLWSIVGFSAAVNLKVYEDFGLLVAGIIGTVLILLSERKTKKIEQG